MTITPNYIRKCEMAEEIQAMRAPKDRQGDYRFEIGDNFAAPGENYYSIEVYGTLICQPCGLLKSAVFYRPVARKPEIAHTVDKIIWLPRLDQLFDIANGVEISANKAFIFTVAENKEEILLTVIMRNKFGKKWNGDNWLAV